MTNTTDKTGAREILAKEEVQAMDAREAMGRKLTSMGAGAVVWGGNVFGTTEYPLISDASGKTHLCQGVGVNAKGEVYAVIDFPAQGDNDGVELIKAHQASERIKKGMMLTSGTPEQWDILRDCLQVALKVLGAERREDAPMPWW